MREAKELDSLAREKGVKNMVGLQGRVSPLILKVKSLLTDQSIGKVLSSTIVAWGGSKSRDSIGEGLKYFMDRSVGGNVLTIGFAHSKYMQSSFMPSLSNPLYSDRLREFHSRRILLPKSPARHSATKSGHPRPKRHCNRDSHVRRSGLHLRER